MSGTQDQPQPPPAPEIRRRLTLHPSQWVGMGLLVLIPILALLGVFGEAQETVSIRTASLAAELHYPTRFRYASLARFHLDVTNTSGAPLDRVTVAFDTAYLARFSDPVAIPDFQRPYLIELVGLGPGETRRVLVEVRGDAYGRHHGEVRIGAGAADIARIPIGTFVFP